MTDAQRGILWGVTAMAAFTSIPIGVRMLSPHLPPAEIGAIRSFLGVLIMLPWAVHVGFGGMKPKRIDLHLLRGLFNGVGMILWFWGLSQMPIADAVALQYTLPLFALLFAVLFIGEKVGIRRATAMAVGFAGAMVIIRPGFAEVSLPTLAVLVSASLYAATFVVMRSQSLNDSPWAIMFWSNLFIGLVALGPALVVWVWPTPETWPWLLFLGIGGWLAHFSLTRALSYGGAKNIAPLDFLRLPFVALVAFPLFGEFPDLLTWVGASVIAAATTYIARRDAQIARRRAAAASEDGPLPPA